jgi:hypothetical protein
MLETERGQGKEQSVAGRGIDIAAILLSGIVLALAVCLVPLQDLETNWLAVAAGGIGLGILAHQALHHTV